MANLKCIKCGGKMVKTTNPNIYFCEDCGAVVGFKEDTLKEQ